MTVSSEHGATRNDRPAPRSRRFRILRRTGLTFTVALALIGALAVRQFFFGAPGVGHFRSMEGRAAYVDAYTRALAALPEPTATRDVSTAFGTVRTYEWNSPDSTETVPIVLVPGRSSGAPMWAENLPDLLEHRRVLAFDALGDAGLSVQGVPMHSFGDQALWMAEVLSELAPSGAHLVGHSFGGATAAAYAHRFPDRVASLTLLEPVFTFASPPARMIAWAMLLSLPAVPDSWRNTALGKIGGAEFDPNNDLAQMIAAAARHFTAALPQPAPLDDEQLRQLDMPTYVAIAEHDSLAGGHSAVERARQLPKATIEVFADTTHSLPMQAREQLAVELKKFWREAESS